ncbi:hypothetical protein [Mycobacterium simiae]|uniref:hypothetical protein n=1 Tax=Mycobacterium simiae TaxID=1784 RepID=UPI0005C83589|nr:hypothetical protein [Mycobacterium simiae]PLV44594.1 hypothetical protein X011_26455 [Mycobacterium tuberculosis variant microti OV254]BBX39600.1 hypothetical protein MSIM_10510 [Mycobacterium simiae]
MPGQLDRSDDSLQRLTAGAAHLRVAEKDLHREIYHAAHDVGVPQRLISEVVGSISQATVQRIIRRIDEDPSRLEETPAEVIDRRAAGLIDDETMMEMLLNRTYSFGHVPSIEGIATDAYIRGDWDQIETAYYRDLLSEGEFSQLMERQRDQLEEAARTEQAAEAEQAVQSY